MTRADRHAELVSQVETLIDVNSVDAVLLAVIDVCYGKADNLRSHCQDKGGAKAWQRAARALERVRDHVYV